MDEVHKIVTDNIEKYPNAKMGIISHDYKQLNIKTIKERII